jgi:hypothetical protein
VASDEIAAIEDLTTDLEKRLHRLSSTALGGGAITVNHLVGRLVRRAVIAAKPQCSAIYWRGKAAALASSTAAFPVLNPISARRLSLPPCARAAWRCVRRTAPG